MAKKVEIDTLNCGDTKYIEVDKHILKLMQAEPHKIEFQNKLDGDPTARLKFYDLDDKGGTVVPNFCDGQADPQYFDIPGTGNGKKTCEILVEEKNYAYTIETPDNSHEPLDPIIIIEPPALMASDLALVVFGVSLVAVSVVSVVACLVGVKVGRSAPGQRSSG